MEFCGFPGLKIETWGNRSAQPLCSAQDDNHDIPFRVTTFAVFRSFFLISRRQKPL
jgi:hypothetical protein